MLILVRARDALLSQPNPGAAPGRCEVRDPRAVASAAGELDVRGRAKGGVLEWLTAAHPDPLLTVLHGRASVRKARLFACA